MEWHFMDNNKFIDPLNDPGTFRNSKGMPV